MARNKYDVDEVLEDKFDLNQLKRLAGYLRPYKIQMGIVLFLMLSASALGMLIPKFVMSVMDVCIPEKDRLYQTPFGDWTHKLLRSLDR